MKAGWQCKKVGEIADHSLGKMLDKAKNRGTPKPYLRNFNVRWFDFDLSDLLQMRFEPEEEGRYTAVKGDVLVCEGGYPGRAAIWQHDEPIYFQKALHRVRFREPERSRWFLYYLHFKDLDGTLKAHFNGAGIQHFTGEALAQFEIPLPPIPEQQRIVAILDEAFEGLATARANAERNIKNARAVFESCLQGVFLRRGEGWVERTFEDAVDADCSLSYGIVQPGDDVPDGMPVIRPTDLTRKCIVADGLKRIDPSRAAGYRRTALQGGELLLCVRGSTGTVAIASPELAGANVTRGIVPLRFRKELLTAEFGYYLLKSVGVQEQIRAKTYGAALMQINIRDVRKLVLAIPPVTEQLRLSRQLDLLSAETQRLGCTYQRKLAEFHALRMSLLHHAFSGRL